jgi:hypothetical protein
MDYRRVCALATIVVDLMKSGFSQSEITTAQCQLPKNTARKPHHWHGLKKLLLHFNKGELA